MDSELQELLVRGVEAIERLAQDPVIELETSPPVCPHCEQMNPLVRVAEKEAQGKLGGFVIQCHCLHCNNVFYAIPFQYGCVREIEDVRQLQAERAELSGLNGG